MSTSTMEFEKPIVELEKQIDELKRTAEKRAARASTTRSRRSSASSTSCGAGDVHEPHAAAARAGGAQRAGARSRSTTSSSRFTDFIELHGDRALSRRCGDRRRLGAARRRDGDGDRPSARPRHQGESQAQLRHAAPRGLPQGAAPDEARREVPRCPVITFIDTPGAWAGLGAEERGQSEAIARNLFEMSRLEVPIVATVIGEGGSGGALALGVADRVLMLENAVYSVITVEGCAAILWKDGKSHEMKERAAKALRITAPDLHRARRDRRDRPRAAGRRARESRGVGAVAAGGARPPPRGAAPLQAGEAVRRAAREVPRAWASSRSDRGPASRRGRVQGQSQGVLPLGWRGASAASSAGDRRGRSRRGLRPRARDRRARGRRAAAAAPHGCGTAAPERKVLRAATPEDERRAQRARATQDEDARRKAWSA